MRVNPKTMFINHISTLVLCSRDLKYEAVPRWVRLRRRNISPSSFYPLQHA